MAWGAVAESYLFLLRWTLLWRRSWSRQITGLFSCFWSLVLAPLVYLTADSAGVAPSTSPSTSAALFGFPQPQPTAPGAAVGSGGSPFEPWTHDQLLAKPRRKNKARLGAIAAQRKRNSRTQVALMFSLVKLLLIVFKRVADCVSAHYRHQLLGSGKRWKKQNTN